MNTLKKERHMKHCSRVLIVFLVVFGFGCSQPRIDATNDQTLEESVERVRESLPESQREEFDVAIAVVSMSQLVNIGGIIAGTVDEEELEKNMRKALHGKTGKEILARSAQIKKHLESVFGEFDLE